MKDRKNLRLAGRAAAAVLALIVIIGSLFFFFGPEKAPGPAGFLPGVSAAHAEGFQTLKKGDSGRAVRAAQEALAKLGYYEGKIDGNFSKILEAAVMDFQQDFGLKRTGRLDEEAYLFLLSDEDTPLPSNPAAAHPDAAAPPARDVFVTEEGEYTDKEHVAAYLRAFGKLPSNYITKKQAEALGWENRLGNLWRVAPGKSICDDFFGNYEQMLPKAKGRKYMECDIDYHGGYRNEKRIVFSNDGLIFYTEDHYATFEEMK